MKKPFFVLMFLFVVICLFVLLRPSDNYSNCSNEQYFLQLSFNGTVLRKFIDASDHSTPKVEIKDLNGQIYSISFFGDYSDLFENKIEIGTTIKKEKNNLLIFSSIEHKSFSPLGEAIFDCDQDAYKNEERKFGFLYKLFN